MEPTNLVVTATEHPTYRYRLDCTVLGAPKTYFGTGFPGVFADAVQWFDPATGLEETDHGFRLALVAHAEAARAAARIAEMAALLAP